jgi:hypothetical protein
MKARKMIFWFRTFSIIDVLFSRRFELTTYRKDGTIKSKTRFSKDEILDKRKEL